MGIYINGYLGPFIVVRSLVNKVQKRQCKGNIETCPMGTVKPQPKYCPECGIASQNAFYTTEEAAVSFYDLVWNQELMDIDVLAEGCIYEEVSDGQKYIYTSLIPNKIKLGQRLNLQSVYEEIMKLTESDPPGDMLKLQEQHAKEIEVLKSAYGDNNVEISWGLVRWAN
ncbi:MAG: hypothetical protein DWQ19_09240 [Crenarchaeota archaeon]|nr:MAG: hypothetical protein DWQ19_09240 [Thermoproteota archaeon]